MCGISSFESKGQMFIFFVFLHLGSGSDFAHCAPQQNNGFLLFIESVRLLHTMVHYSGNHIQNNRLPKNENYKDTNKMIIFQEAELKDGNFII